MGRREKSAKTRGEGRRPRPRKSPGALLRETRRALAEAVEQQAATAAILRVIASSPADIQPVLDAVAKNAARLCEADDAEIYRVDGDVYRRVAHHGPVPIAGPLGEAYPITRGRPSSRAIVDRTTIHVHDQAAQAATEFPDVRAWPAVAGVRTVLATPLLRDDVALGVIVIRRTEVKPFSDEHIALLRTFADQATIAIENVRLFTALQEKNRALTETLEQQTATGEILRVIASSPTDFQPVFDAILKSALTLCEGSYSGVYLVSGDMVDLVAHSHRLPESLHALKLAWPMPVQSPESLICRAIRERTIVHVSDTETDPTVPAASRERSRLVDQRAMLAVPMLREEVPIGAIRVARPAPTPFTDTQIELLKTFAAQAVIAIENVRLFTELQAKNQALTEAHAQVTEALEQQTATAEILRAIAASPTEIQPVLDTIARNAARVCNALDASLVLIGGDTYRIVARFGPLTTPLGLELPLDRRSMPGRAAIDRQTIAVEDTRELPETEYPLTREFSRRYGHRSAVATPLLRQGAAIGALFVRRAEVNAFTEGEIALLKTFADQAVIAIENVRLFNETREALQQQTATSEILRVISSSPTNVQPVFEAIVTSGVALFEGAAVAVVWPEEGQVRLAAIAEADAERAARWRERFPCPLTGDYMHGVALVERRLVDVPDVLASDVAEPGRQNFLASGYRAITIIPMLREQTAIGAISVVRPAPGALSDKQLALLKTFADQAVIAIENVRLFNELQQNNEALTRAHAQVTEALEQKTATAEILRVISSSPTELQPVLDAVVQSAARLCNATDALIYRLKGERLELVAKVGDVPHPTNSLPLTRGLVTSRAVLDRQTLHVEDLAAQLDQFPEAAPYVRDFGHRTILATPLLREDVAVGVIAIRRTAVRPFSHTQIELLKTFADQAVIAIENVRLFNELQARTSELTRSVDELTALGEVGQALGSTLDLETVLRTIVTRANQLAGTAGCVIWEYDESRAEFRLRASHYADELDTVALPGPGGTTTIPKGHGVTTQVVELRRPVQISDIAIEGAYDSPVRAPLLEAGHRALLGVPLIFEEDVIGVLAVTRKTPGEFAPEIVRLLTTFATQSALAIQNARLFREIEEKSRELAAASQHKSEFLANMSHELRTPLNAIIGFSEVLTERMFGELNDKQDEYLRDIHASGQHLLSLINDILDLSKIEAGRMELELVDFHLPAAIDDALTLVRERASRRGVTLQGTVDERLGDVRADQRKVKQVLLNLLSNAIKFTPEGGRIQVRAVPVDGSVELSVSDTGVGIAPEDHDAVFEEFRQVGTADKKAEGTGLGLALCKKFVELHGGRIWVKSQVGAGSTFTFTLPLRR